MHFPSLRGLAVGQCYMIRSLLWFYRLSLERKYIMKEVKPPSLGMFLIKICLTIVAVCTSVYIYFVYLI